LWCSLPNRRQKRRRKTLHHNFRTGPTLTGRYRVRRTLKIRDGGVDCQRKLEK
jgi:hypothetical protein